jgi:hypothetical protein
MASEKQIAANRQNAKKVLAPKPHEENFVPAGTPIVMG